ncbi:ABC transporter permease, partial [uncultured Corynebacterium sp.]|uniref:ABC transporter permease n=1 Tax=uncultured Corynebacterium sp. TaxID=159447 RepID=UPI0025DB5D15
MTGDGGTVGWVGLLVSLVFIAIAMAVTSGFHLKLNRPIVWAVARSLVQMGIVGFALVLVVDPGTPIWWSWAWVVGIVGFASFTVKRRAPQVPGLLWVSVVAYATVAASSLAILFGFGIFEMSNRALVPVAGMVIGNSMKVGVVAATRVAEFATDQRAEVEA